MSWDKYHQMSFSVEECPFNIYQTWDISCSSLRYIPENKPTTSDWHIANCGTDRIPCHYLQRTYTQQDSAWIEFGSWLSHIPFWLVASYIIIRTSYFFSWSSSSPFHNSKSCLQKHVTQVRLELNRAEQQTLQPMRHLVRHTSNADTK
jgi:hypothetical protein